MRELRSDFNPVVASRWERSLLVQRLRALLQDERDQPTFGQAQELKSGTVFEIFFLANTSSHGGQSTEIPLNTDFIVQNLNILMLLR